MLAYTVSGSIYEIDLKNRQARRLKRRDGADPAHRPRRHLAALRRDAAAEHRSARLLPNGTRCRSAPKPLSTCGRRP